jgi:hypothetical protein
LRSNLGPVYVKKRGVEVFRGKETGLLADVKRRERYEDLNSPEPHTNVVS